MIAIRKNVEFRKTERNPDLSGNHNGEKEIVFARSACRNEAISTIQLNYPAPHKYSRIPFVQPFDKLRANGFVGAPLNDILLCVILRRSRRISYKSATRKVVIHSS